jgi:hypothetical protein
VSGPKNPLGSALPFEAIPCVVVRTHVGTYALMGEALRPPSLADLFRAPPFPLGPVRRRPPPYVALDARGHPVTAADLRDRIERQKRAGDWYATVPLP